MLVICGVLSLASLQGRRQPKSRGGGTEHSKGAPVPKARESTPKASKGWGKMGRDILLSSGDWAVPPAHKNLLFTVRRSALHGLCDRNSVCPSHSWTVHMVRPTIMISSPYGSPIILISGDITISPKFEGGHPDRGR